LSSQKIENTGRWQSICLAIWRQHYTEEEEYKHLVKIQIANCVHIGKFMWQLSRTERGPNVQDVLTGKYAANISSFEYQ
jgi:hypothetical protein